MVELGINARLSEINAALGLSQLRKLPDFLEARREIAKRYIEELKDYELLDRAHLRRGHSWHLFVIRTDAENRDDLMVFLQGRGIHTQVHYEPVPLQPWFRQRLGEVRFPHAQSHAQRSISLPMYPSLDDGQARVIDALHDWMPRRAAA